MGQVVEIRPWGKDDIKPAERLAMMVAADDRSALSYAHGLNESAEGRVSLLLLSSTGVSGALILLRRPGMFFSEMRPLAGRYARLLNMFPSPRQWLRLRSLKAGCSAASRSLRISRKLAGLADGRFSEQEIIDVAMRCSPINDSVETLMLPIMLLRDEMMKQDKDFIAARVAEGIDMETAIEICQRQLRHRPGDAEYYDEIREHVRRKECELA